MKVKILVALAAGLLLTSCGVRYGIYQGYNERVYYATPEQVIRKQINYNATSGRTDPKSGAYVDKAVDGRDLTYKITIDELIIFNRGDAVEVYRRNAEDNELIRSITKLAYGTTEYAGHINSKPVRVVIDVRGAGTYVRIYSGNQCLNRFAF
mgnify:CR=1 FL=1